MDDKNLNKLHNKIDKIISIVVKDKNIIKEISTIQKSEKKNHEDIAELEERKFKAIYIFLSIILVLELTTFFTNIYKG